MYPGTCGPTKTVVCPTKFNQVNTCSQSNVNYVHPSHTNVLNHHLVKNTHFYPHTTSYQNTVSHVNQYGGAFFPPQQPVARPWR
ncbi:spore coat protein D [Natronobacillus azotifigens]|uniref:CotD family spore coat protein n=1 Tax=Natronobacillus azotifigens TaxID=472978 RepID=A0A9J6R8D9_9BACI|nr:CotD family spore coat protein [Natronobacillus azotifigens]MCZ0701893.1 CotD family spore coat protein [Natronobacillus azotifigens]